MALSSKTYETSASQENFSDPAETLIFFDWDDTLCPSCWIQDNADNGLDFFSRPEEDRFLAPLRVLDNLVAQLLKTALQLGKVVIVTAAESPWVPMSCKNFLPGVEPLLDEITVLYAEEVYQQSEAARGPPVYHSQSQSSEAGMGAPGMYVRGRNAETSESFCDLEADPRRWKEAAFQKALTEFYSRRHPNLQSWKNVVSIGDAPYERDALRSVVVTRPTKNKQCRTKTVKMLQEPTIEELAMELKVIHEGFSLIVSYPGNVDVEVTEDDIDLGIDTLEKLMDT